MAAALFAAHLNAARGKANSGNWFAHYSDNGEGLRRNHPRNRPDGVDILSKNVRTAESLSQMAVFVDAAEPSCVSRRLRSNEAKTIAERLSHSTDNLCDFEGNLANGSTAQRAPRVGASLGAKETMEKQAEKCYWFAHDGSKPPAMAGAQTAGPRGAVAKRPVTAKAQATSSDWFGHFGNDQESVNTPQFPTC